MEKFLKIGEQYVQWIALGLGAVYLILMGVFYVAQPPITVALDKKEYLPGEIDQQIKQGALSAIEKDMTSKAPWVTPKPGDAVAAIKASLVDHAPQGPPTELVRADKGPLPTQPADVPDTAPSLVIPPAPEVAAVPPSTGTSVLNILQPAPAVPAANAAAAAAPAAVAAAPVQPVISPQDHDWNTYGWVVKAKALDDAFKAAHIPDLPNVYQTAFLRVELVRQEVLGNGKFGPELVMPDITTVPLEPLPPEGPPTTSDDKADFLNRAVANAQGILQPPFFDVVYGTKWYPPGTPRPDDVFAPPGAPLPGTVAPGVPLPGVAPRSGNVPGGVPMPGPGRPGIIHGPAVAPAAPRGIVPPTYRPYQPPVVAPAVAPGVLGDGGQPGVGVVGGFINPAALVADISIYTHDWSVEAGHVYRYKMRYWIANPLFNVKQVNVKQADQDLLAIKSDYSAWTAPIEIPSRFKFWVQKFQRNLNNEVTFDLFTKKPGVPGGVERSTIRVTPGDTIGASPWMLVDVRADSNRRNYYYFLVADPAGHIERHDLEKDAKDVDHVDLLERTGAAARVGG